jgi:Domain of unknown function (DUF4602)
MTSSGDEGLSDLEAAIELRLSTWTPDEVEHKAMVLAGKRKTKLSKRQKRHRVIENEEQPSESKLLESHAELIAQASRAALDRALVRPRGTLSSASVAAAGKQAARANPPEYRVVTGESSSLADELKGRDVGGVRSVQKVSAGGVPAETAKSASSASAFVEKHRREVGELGATALEKKDQKAYEARRRLEQGCKRLKSQKLPLPMLLGMRKKQRARDVKAKELALASGMLIRSKRKSK